MTLGQPELLKDDADGRARAVEVWRAGGLVGFPTETVYGLGADATSDESVARIYEAKGRPSFNPLIVHVSNLEAACTLVEMDDLSRRLAGRFWPGPLTLVLPLKTGALVSKLVTAGLQTLAVRVPATPLARDLLGAFCGPIAAPSANPSGRVSPTQAAHVVAGLGARIEAVIDGGDCAVGLESTIVAVRDGRLHVLRDGGVAREALEEFGVVYQADDDPTAPQSPGQLASHYAPAGTVRMNAHAPEAGEVMVGYGDVPGEISLSHTGDLVEAAGRLFGVLHQLDNMGAQRIAVAPIPEVGLGRAINDRLRRAAAAR